MLINHTIPNLMNGVSQQPPTIRLPNQAEEQINASCRVANGLSKRLAVEMLTLFDGTPVNAQRFDHPISSLPLTWNPDYVASQIVRLPRRIGQTTVYEEVQFLVNTLAGIILIKNLTRGFTFGPFAEDYLAGASKKDIKFLADGKDVYILNKMQRITKVAGTFGPDNDDYTRMQGSLAYVRSGLFSTRYTLTLEIYHADTGALIKSFTPAVYDSLGSGVAGSEASIKTATIMNGGTGLATVLLGTVIAADGGIYSGKIVSDVGNNWCVFRPTQGAAQTDRYRLELTLMIDTAQTNGYSYNGVVKDVLTLPPQAKDGYTIKVDPDPTQSSEHYWLKYSKKDQGWIETKQPGEHVGFTPESLPLKITDAVVDPIEGVDDPQINHIVINAREVGDAEVAPDPSFFANQINDMFIFNNRLGFLSKNNIILSKIDDYETFYRTSCAQVLAADRVDITAAIPSTRYTELKFAIPFETNLMIFGTSAQYLLSTTTGFDLTKTALQTSTEYECSDLCAPANLGSSIYFPVDRTGFSGIYDLSRKDGIGLTAEESTNHISNYIKGSVTEMSYSSPENILFVKTNNDPNTIYIQNRFVRQTVLEQNAWHKWTLPHKLLTMQVVGPYLHVTMVAEDNQTIIYGKIDITIKKIVQGNTTEIDFDPFIDNRYLAPMGTVISVDSVEEGEYFVAPETADNLIGVNINGGIVRGITAINAALEEEDLWIGLPYTFTYVFSQQTPATYDDSGKTVYQYAQLILRSMKISYEATGKFDITVKPKGRAAFETEFTGTILSDEDSILGRINLSTGVFKFPINCRSDQVKITISSDYPYPCTFNTCEWQGALVNKARRI